MRNKSPQEKKRLSYERDRRNAYGENDKASRKSIHRHKRAVVHAYRKLTKQTLPKGAAPLDTDSADVIEAKVRSVRRKSWRKVPDMPLGEFVTQQRERAARRRRRKSKTTGED